MDFKISELIKVIRITQLKEINERVFQPNYEPVKLAKEFNTVI